MLQITLTSNTPEGLEDEISKYMYQYHPAGYGTRVLVRYEKEGKYYADISRYSSCD
jgi:hypothetical protein